MCAPNCSGVELPGFAFAYWMNSCSDFTGSPGFTTSTSGAIATQQRCECDHFRMTE
jgi:hypothetical protein